MELTERISSGVNTISLAMAVTAMTSNELAKEQELGQIKNKIKIYFKTHKKAYISDIAEKINVAPSLVIKACDELKKEGFLRDL